MNAFVDTFGIEILLTKEEHISLTEKDYKLFTYDKDEKIWTIKHYENRGLRAVITSADSSPQKVNHTIEDSQYALRFEVTLPKLLARGKNLGNPTKRNEIEDACKKLDKMIRKIEEMSGGNLLEKAKLCWGILAKDVITPNEFYSHEIIEAACNALDIYDEYQNYSSLVDDLWRDEDYVRFVCNNVSGVLYNKKHDLLESPYQSEVEALGEHGLLCFELAIFADILKKDYLIENCIRFDSLPETLYQLTIDGNTLLNKYFGSVFCGGAMLSRRVLKEYLKTNCKIDQKEIKSMINFSDWIRKMGAENLMYYGTFDRVCLQVADFEKLKISPVRLSKRCPYIPSFSDMINDTIDDKLFSVALQATEHRREKLTYWNLEKGN